jgi:hypothetical protein
MPRKLLVLPFLLPLIEIQFSFGETVYDSLSPSMGAYGFAVHSEIGQSIDLEGSARSITRMDVFLGTNTPDGFRLRFYTLDIVNGEPENLIWESPLQTFPYDPPSYNRKFVRIDIPKVDVPDTFAWTIKPTVPPSNLAVQLSQPPTVGTHHDAWLRRLDLSWTVTHLGTGAFGARVMAVPEPSPLLLLIFWFCTVFSSHGCRPVTSPHAR